MTDDQIIAEFERREAEGNRAKHGADHQRILADVSALAGRDVSEVRALILDNTFTEPN